MILGIPAKKSKYDPAKTNLMFIPDRKKTL